MNSEPSGVMGSDEHGFWKFGPHETPVTIKNAEALLAYLPYHLAGWDISWAGLSSTTDPDIYIEEYADGTISVSSYGRSDTDSLFENPYEAANGLAKKIVHVHTTRDQDTICLNAGAVEINGGLVVIVGDLFAEKSSVALHLSVLGYRLFGTEQIAISMGSDPIGTCVGLMPKVRLPLPYDCGDAFREFVEGYSSMQNEEVAYLKLWDREAADFRESAPVSAIVFLDPRKAARSSIELDLKCDFGSKMASIAYAPHIDASVLRSGLTQFVEHIPSYILRFTSGREAAALISKEWHNASAVL